MLPILISEAAPIGEILGILAVKFVLGMIYGFIIDFVIRLKNKNRAEESNFYLAFSALFLYHILIFRFTKNSATVFLIFTAL